jgi:hypothetical protein
MASSLDILQLSCESPDASLGAVQPCTVVAGSKVESSHRLRHLGALGPRPGGEIARPLSLAQLLGLIGRRCSRFYLKCTYFIPINLHHNIFYSPYKTPISDRIDPETHTSQNCPIWLVHFLISIPFCVSSFSINQLIYSTFHRQNHLVDGALLYLAPGLYDSFLKRLLSLWFPFLDIFFLDSPATLNRHHSRATWCIRKIRNTMPF